MGKFVKGEVVVLPFPFSDLSHSKKRPALVLAPLSGDDVILCQITSKAMSDPYALELVDTDFTTGNLHQESKIRPNRIFTADSKIILYRVGILNKSKIEAVLQQLCSILNS